MPRVFVSYRHQDTGPFAARLAARLRRDLSLENAFLDKAKIGAGESWREVLDAELLSADAVLVLVGAAWAGAGGRRIHVPDDMVAWELRRALALPRDLVPTMVDGARWPEELPGDLAVLHELNFIDLNPADSPLGYLELLGDLFYKAVRHHGDVVVVHDESDTAKVHVRELAARLTSGVPVEDAEQLVRAVSRGFEAIPLGEAAARWPEVIVLVGEGGMTPALLARVRGLEHNRVRTVIVTATAAGIAGFIAGRTQHQTNDEPPPDGTAESPEGAASKGGEESKSFVHHFVDDEPTPGPPPVRRWLTVAGALLATVIVIGFGAGAATGWVRWPPWSTPTPTPTSTPTVSPSETLVVPASLTVDLTSGDDEVRWGDPPFRVVARTSKPAVTTFTTEGPCRVDPISAGEPTTEASATVTMTGAGSCDLTARAEASEERQTDRLIIMVGRARPVITFDDVSVPLTNPFVYPLRATVQPELPLSFSSKNPGCPVSDGVLRIPSQLILVMAAGGGGLPVRCVVEAGVAPSDDVEAVDPVRATITVTAPEYRLDASPSGTQVTWKEGDDVNPPSNDVTVTLTEPSGLSLGVAGKPDRKNCFVGKAQGLPYATEFTVVVSLGEYPRPEGYTCTIDWAVTPFPGAEVDHATTTITVLPP